MKTCFILILSAIVPRLCGQTNLAFGFMGNNLALQCNQISLANNPGSGQKYRQQAGMVARNRFAGTDLVQGGVAGHFSAKNTVYGLQIQYAGTQWFYRSGIMAAIAQKFSEKLQVGLSAGGIQTRQSQYQNNNNLYLKIGMQYRVSDKIGISSVIVNPWQINYRLMGESAAGHISFEYIQNKNTQFYLHAKHKLDETPVLGIALKQSFSEKFELMISGQIGLEPIAAVIVFTQKNFQLKAASTYHNYLGFSPCIVLLWFRQ